MTTHNHEISLKAFDFAILSMRVFYKIAQHNLHQTKFSDSDKLEMLNLFLKIKDNQQIVKVFEEIGLELELKNYETIEARNKKIVQKLIKPNPDNQGEDINENDDKTSEEKPIRKRKILIKDSDFGLDPKYFDQKFNQFINLVLGKTDIIEDKEVLALIFEEINYVRYLFDSKNINTTIKTIIKSLEVNSFEDIEENFNEEEVDIFYNFISKIDIQDLHMIFSIFSTTQNIENNYKILLDITNIFIERTKNMSLLEVAELDQDFDEEIDENKEIKESIGAIFSSIDILLSTHKKSDILLEKTKEKLQIASCNLVSQEEDEILKTIDSIFFDLNQNANDSESRDYIIDISKNLLEEIIKNQKDSIIGLEINKIIQEKNFVFSRELREEITIDEEIATNSHTPTPKEMANLSQILQRLLKEYQNSNLDENHSANDENPSSSPSEPQIEEQVISPRINYL